MRRFQRSLIVLLAGAVVAAALGLLAGAPDSAAAGANAATPHTINVTGEATVQLKPDRAIVRVGVDLLRETAVAAHEGGAQALTAVVEAMARLGIPAENLQTSEITMHPEYEYVEEREPASDGMVKVRGRQVLKGYRFRSSLTLTVDDLAKVGPAIDAAVAAGGNTVDSIQFTVKDEKAAKLAAQVEAIRHARQQAEQAARELGLTITGVQAVNLQNIGFNPPIVRLERDAGIAKATMAAVPVLGGQVTLNVAAQVTFLTD